eukprot:m.100754 g.100754  ORF g.100754 m.100754 type:complete len:162 (+) comp9050_c2_seq1:220-705(+)
MPFCQFCGSEDAARYCGRCGRPQGENPPRSDIDYNKIEKEIRDAGDADQGGEIVLFEGTTWPYMCISPLMCNVNKWRISNKRIDYEHGCCGNTVDTIDMRRVKDLALRRRPWQRIFFRGTIVVYADAEASHDEIHITMTNAHSLYLKLRKTWTTANVGVVG